MRHIPDGPVQRLNRPQDQARRVPGIGKHARRRARIGATAVEPFPRLIRLDHAVLRQHRITMRDGGAVGHPLEQNAFPPVQRPGREIAVRRMDIMRRYGRTDAIDEGPIPHPSDLCPRPKRIKEGTGARRCIAQLSSSWCGPEPAQFLTQWEPNRRGVVDVSLQPNPP